MKLVKRGHLFAYACNIRQVLLIFISMRIFKTFGLILASVVCLNSYCQKIDSLTAGQIVERFVEVSGGREKIRSITNSRFYCKLSDASDTIFTVILKARPQQLLIRAESLKHGKGWQLFNNGRSAQMVYGKIMAVTDSFTLEEWKLQSFILPDAYYNELGYSLVKDEDVTIGGKNCYHIRVRSPKGAVTHNYYEKHSGFLVMIQKPTGISYYADYQPEQGFMIPRKGKLQLPDGTLINIIVSEVKLNENINPKIFEIPENISAGEKS